MFGPSARADTYYGLCWLLHGRPDTSRCR